MNGISMLGWIPKKHPNKSNDDAAMINDDATMMDDDDTMMDDVGDATPCDENEGKHYASVSNS